MESLSSSAFLIAPFIPFAPSVRTSSAPYAFKRFLRSRLIVSGSVRIVLYPLAVATAAIPIPVLPLVGSMIVAPSLRIPFSSASSIMASVLGTAGRIEKLELGYDLRPCDAFLLLIVFQGKKRCSTDQFCCALFNITHSISFQHKCFVLHYSYYSNRIIGIEYNIAPASVFVNEFYLFSNDFSHALSRANIVVSE